MRYGPKNPPDQGAFVSSSMSPKGFGENWRQNGHQMVQTHYIRFQKGQKVAKIDVFWIIFFDLISSSPHSQGVCFVHRESSWYTFCAKIFTRGKNSAKNSSKSNLTSHGRDFSTLSFLGQTCSCYVLKNAESEKNQFPHIFKTPRIFLTKIRKSKFRIWPPMGEIFQLCHF